MIRDDGTYSSLKGGGTHLTVPPRSFDDVGSYSRNTPDQQNPKHGDAQNEVYGRHGDISPRNILWYDDGDSDDEDDQLRGTLKITNFGQAEISLLPSKTTRGEVLSTLTYRPPEDDFPDSIIQLSYDIWSLGCVYLEFVTWLVGGHELVKSFSRSRAVADYFDRYITMDTFYEVEKDPERSGIRVKVNPKVIAVCCTVL